jgi:hypothetical protein
MTETAADEQDLAKALDSVASAATNFTSPTTTVQPSTDLGAGLNLPPIVPPESPIAPAVVEPFVSPLTPPSDDTTPAVHSVHGGSDEDEEGTDSNNGSNDTSSRDNVVTSTDNAPSGPLADIKNDALNELRPLVGKLNVAPEEKFDTYLLLIRSTDDTELIGPAHEAAKAIEDEARRAEALLDIIKEIDYLSRQDKHDN